MYTFQKFYKANVSFDILGKDELRLLQVEENGITKMENDIKVQLNRLRVRALL